MLGLPKRPSIHRPLLSINQCFVISLDASCTALPDDHVFFFFSATQESRCKRLFGVLDWGHFGNHTRIGGLWNYGLLIMLTTNFTIPGSTVCCRDAQGVPFHRFFWNDTHDCTHLKGPVIYLYQDLNLPAEVKYVPEMAIHLLRAELFNKTDLEWIEISAWNMFVMSHRKLPGESPFTCIVSHGESPFKWYVPT